MELSPIVLFVYNRPDHTRKTVEALQKNMLAKDSELFVFSDAPKRKEDAEKVVTVRDYLKTITGFKNVTVVKHQENYGLAKSIVSGVSEIVNRFGKVIVLEDDLITSPYFLTYMNDALSVYENEKQVMHVSGYFYPVREPLPETFFYNVASCWGWGTWVRAWKCFNPSAKELLKQLQASGRMEEFNLDGKFNYSSTLKANASGYLNTWAIKWYASVFLKNGFCLHPSVSLVRNIGHDGSGINSGISQSFNIPVALQPVKLQKLDLKESLPARQAATNFLEAIKPSFLQRIFTKIRLIYKHAA